MSKPKIIHTITELRKELKQHRLQGKSIGLLITMGKLHAAHTYLASVAKQNADIIVVSNVADLTDITKIEDHEHCNPNPSTPRDAETLINSGTSILFAPSRAELYPRGWNGHSFVDVPEVTGILDDVGRMPGYFKGVATAVIKLFNIVQPDVSVWGEKDYQQFAVVRKMVTDLSLPIDLISVPSIRYESGLAYSSRNEKLSTEELSGAHYLYEAMVRIRRRVLAGISPNEATKDAKAFLEAHGMKYHYIQIREASTLAPATVDSTNAIIIASAYLGKERLVDTLRI